MSVAARPGARGRAGLLPPLAASVAGTGRPIVLVHGFPSDGGVFAGQLEAAGSGRIRATVHAVDLPGFGRTPAPDPPLGLLDVGLLVRAVVDYLDARGLEQAVVGGLAIGGYVAIELAAALPDRVAALVLLGVKPEPDAPANGPRREAVAGLALDGGAVAVARELADEPFAPASPAEPRAAFRSMVEAADPRAIAALVRGLHRRPDPKPALRRIAAAAIPALVLAGAADPFTKIDDARRLAELLPGSTFKVIADAGHVVPLEQPDAVTDAIGGFLAALRPPGPRQAPARRPEVPP